MRFDRTSPIFVVLTLNSITVIYSKSAVSNHDLRKFCPIFIFCSSRFSFVTRFFAFLALAFIAISWIFIQIFGIYWHSLCDIQSQINSNGPLKYMIYSNFYTKIHGIIQILHRNKKIICELIPILLVGISSEFPEKMSSNRSKSERMSQRYHRINATRNGKWYSRATNTTVWTIENTRNSDSTKFRCDPYGIGVQWY